MKTTYKEYEIVYRKHDGTWSCEELNISADQLEGLEKKIDAIFSAERKLPRIKVFSLPRYDKPELGEVTSLSADKGRGYGRDANNYCNVTFGKKRRSTHIRYLALATDANLALLDEWKKANAEYEAARKKMDAVAEKIPATTRAELMAAGQKGIAE